MVLSKKQLKKRALDWRKKQRYIEKHDGDQSGRYSKKKPGGPKGQEL